MPFTPAAFIFLDSFGLLLIQVYFAMANQCDNQVPVSDRIAYPTELRVAIIKWKPPVVRITWKHEEFRDSPPGNDTSQGTAAAPSGAITLKRFELSYRPTHDEFRSVLNLPREARLVSLDRLRPGTEYELYLSAVSSKGLRNDTAPIYFTAPEVVKENDTLSKVPRTISGGPKEESSDKSTTVGLVTVREEEIVIVAIVLAVWVAVILLFFNKWGKIRMLEPYQPQYRDGMEDVAPYSPTGGPKAPRVSVSDPIGTGAVQVHVFDRDQTRFSPTPSYRANRPRQNSVFIGNAYGSKAYIMQDSGSLPRKFKSEENLKSLVVQITNCDEDDDDPLTRETTPL